ncbi:MAG: cytochrome P450, partial [Chloroflexota bacterium]
RGSLVLVNIASANTDEGRFPSPGNLDLARMENKHLSFGHGAHYCLGAPLARMEGRIAIGGLLKRFPNISLAAPVETLRWRRGMSLRGLQKLPVRF